MTRIQISLAGLMAVVLLLAAYQPSQSDPPKQDQKVQARAPEPLRIEHTHLHRQLENAIQSGGKTGEAAKTVARRMAPHFEKEEQIATPPLGLLSSLSQGTATKEEMRQILPLTERLKEELPEMLKEHEQIVLALKELSKAAKAEDKAEVAEFAEKLILHARTEEQVLYPAAILVGEHIKLKLKMEE